MNSILEYREPGKGWFFFWVDRALIFLIATFLWVSTRLFCRVTVLGKENIPKGGRILFLINHPSYLGIFATVLAVFWPWVLGSHMDMIPLTVGKAEYVNVRLWRWLLVHFNVMALPKQKEIRSDIVRSQVWVLTKLHNCAHWLYPEGTRTENGQHLGAFRPGVGRVVAETRPQIVFVYDHGSAQSWPKGHVLPCLPIAWWHGIPYPRRFPVTINISRPISSTHGSLTGVSRVCDSVSLEESGEPVALYIRDLFWAFVVRKHSDLSKVESVSPRIDHRDLDILI